MCSIIFICYLIPAVFATKVITYATYYVLLPMFSILFTYYYYLLTTSQSKKSAELVFHIPTVFLILKSFCVIFAHHRFDLLSSLLYCFFSLCYDQNKYRVATFLLVFYYIYAHKYYLFRLLI